ncbi:MAG: C25 family cysteine peptidase [Bacteroidia bacterium]|nr:C25 family cysteine peptidase [Bacteroidia bacterium]
MKKYTILSILLLGIVSAFAQFDYGNDWYIPNAGKPFVKLIVEEDGIYRVSRTDLTSAGFDISNVGPSNLQLFYRGREVPIFVGTNAGQISYVEFFGFANDGRLDSIMYRDPVTGVVKDDLQPSKEFSLFTDKSAYFLTYDSNPIGRRLFNVFDPTYGSYTAEASFTYETRKDYHPSNTESIYLPGGSGAFDTFFTLNSDYVTGEGYVGPGFSYNVPAAPLNVSIETPAATNVNKPVVVKARVFGRSNSQHILNVSLNDEGVVIDSTLSTNQVYISSFSNKIFLQGSMPATSNLAFTALSPGVDNNHLVWASIKYDRQTDMIGDSTIKISDFSNGSKAYFEFENAVGDDSVYVYDMSNGIRQVGLMNNGRARVIVFPFANSRDLYLATDRGIKKPRIESANLNSLFQRQGADYVIITHRDLKESAEKYAQYRDTAKTIDLSTTIIYTDEIYDEFSYGSMTPWAIKRFCKYALDNWSVKPEYFFIWGKGRYETRLFEDAAIVPTYGYPSTDYEFISHFNPNSIEINPEAAIGRVNVFNNEQGFQYLDKINSYEHEGWAAWMKNGVFLGGGNNSAEQRAIEDAFNANIGIFSNIPFGGRDFYFQKRSNSVVIDPATASYHDQITSGVSLIHFFGHSTSNILDISLREPDQYNNFGRPVFMIAFGCYGGDFSGATVSTSFGERWISEPRRGAIGYLANSSAGYLPPLKNYGSVLYNVMYGPMAGQPIGKVIQRTLDLYTDSLQGIQYRNHGRQLNLQGDPALTLFYPRFPDLEVNETSVFITPDDFTAQDDSFKINVVVSNFGLVTEDSFTIQIRHQLPNGSIYNGHPRKRYPMVAFRDTFSYILKNPVGNGMTGQNVFEIIIDPEDNIDEYSEDNNSTRYSRLVSGNIAAILYPQEYAIVGEEQISLKASAFFMTPEDDIPFIFEIDTSYQFNSPFKKVSEVITGKATFVEWQLPFQLEENQVYYWRVRLANVNPISWSESSFKYIPTKSGWAQARFPQFLRNSTNNVSLNEFQQKFDFNFFGAEFEFVGGSNGTNFVYNKNGILGDNASLNGFSVDGVVWIIIDQFTLEPITGSNQTGNLETAQTPFQAYKLRDAIYNMKDGDYIAIGNRFNPQVGSWDPTIFDALKEIGVSDNFKVLKNGDNFLILGRKGNSQGSAIELYSANKGNSFIIETDLYAQNDKGKVTSTRVGPALAWDNMIWDWNSLDPVNQEVVTVDVWGIRNSGMLELLQPNVGKGTFDLSGIDATEYPYIELRANLTDTIYHTAPQVDNWHIFYEPATDAVVDLATNYVFESDTVFEGQDVFIHMAARNIGPRDMDSVEVALSVERENRSRLILDTLKIAPLLVNGSAIEFEYRFNTLGKELSGDVLYIVEVNPGLKQPETNFFNNIFVKNFHVVNDNQNPLLDVTFDGKHIMDGDIIAPNPEIIIEVNDENQYVAIDDTNAFELYFKRGVTAGTSFERVFIEGDPRIEWKPASLPDNRARLYFYPGMTGMLADGEYTLRVQGKDKNGNAAGGGGANFYEIRFRVENASSITQVLNYPNPFSTSTRFVYTLTGAQLPEVFQIHIYTISGRMVKMIDLLELGEVYFGNNITNYAWDGTDQYGDPLANGVYLYRTVLKVPGEEIEVRDEKTKRFFNNGWGKMVIMR